MIEMDLTREDLDCLGWHRADDDEWSERAEAMMNALIASAPKQRRVRRPTLESTVKQLLKAAQAAGVSIAVIVEGDTVTATPARGIATANREDRTPGEPPLDAPAGRSLFKTRAHPKQKVVL
jgi:hypothetical protein